MKKFNIYDEYTKVRDTVYLSNSHDAISAATILAGAGYLDAFYAPSVTEAPMSQQDMLSLKNLSYYDIAYECREETPFGMVEPCEKELSAEESFQDCYVLPNGNSAHFGLTGTEIAEMPPTALLYTVSLCNPLGFVAHEKQNFCMNELLTAVDRDIVFATEDKAKQAYNAMFGSLFGAV
jgi:hypothetical protein